MRNDFSDKILGLLRVLQTFLPVFYILKITLETWILDVNYTRYVDELQTKTRTLYTWHIRHVNKTQIASINTLDSTFLARQFDKSKNKIFHTTLPMSILKRKKCHTWSQGSPIGKILLLFVWFLNNRQRLVCKKCLRKN